MLTTSPGSPPSPRFISHNTGDSAVKLKLKRLAALSAILASTMGGSLGIASSASAHIQIVHGFNGYCLDDTGWSKTAGQVQQIYPCLYPTSSHMNQEWGLIHVGTDLCHNNPFSRCDIYLLQNAYSGQCLDDWANTNGYQTARQWGCNLGDPAERFQMNVLWNGEIEWWHYGFSNCLDNWNNTGTTIDFWGCNGTDAQAWTDHYSGV